MATTTPNYGWAVPTSTDLVKDGATAIETLGDAIDASMNTALGTKKAGLVLLNTTSFTSVASASLPQDTFTSAYENYLIVLSISAVTSDGSLFIKLRASGTDSSANYYFGGYGWATNNTGSNTYGSNITSGFSTMDLDSGSSAKPVYSRIEVYTPKLAQPTNFTFQGSGSRTDGIPVGYSGYALHTPSTAYDSLSFIASAGNISGKALVYGFNI